MTSGPLTSFSSAFPRPRPVTAAPAPLTAAWTPPRTHNGTRFAFTLSFSKPVNLSYKNLRDEILHTTSATVSKAKRTAKDDNQHWNITIEPHNTDTVTITLNPDTACNTATSIVTEDFTEFFK